MNWKLIFLLSLFGLAMALATISTIPSQIEPLVWLPIFLICAYIIARRQVSRPFWHGVLLGIANSVWITGLHIVFSNEFMAHHPREIGMLQSMPRPDLPRLMMAMTGPIIGVITGIIIGLLALLAGKLLRPRRAALP